MPPLNLLIKPASGNCNMRCRYCFYHDVQENRDVFSFGFMSEETLEILIRKALAFASEDCTFGFQGGEPTLSGLSFFRRVVELQQQYNTKNLTIHNAIQTNGMLIDDEWAQFFADNHFLVGLSLDGHKDINDLNRLDAGHKGAYSRILKAAQCLAAHQVDFNILTVVTGYTANSINKIYNFFRRSNLLYQQYIPCLDPLGEERGGHDWSLTPEKYARFLKTLFDLWYQDVKAKRFIYIRYFENLVGMLLGYPPESCGLSGRCVIQHVVEADGSVYPCDFYALDEMRLGNIREDSFEQLGKSKAALDFLAVPTHEAPACQGCRWRPICRGGCRRDREPVIGGMPAQNYFCPSYQEFFAYAYPRLEEIAGELRRGKAPFANL